MLIEEYTVNRLRVKTEDIINSDLWRLFPVINVDKTKDIPCDYPGAMGVPITVMDKLNREQFELLDMARPKIGGRELYVRFIIRNLHPKLPEEIDLMEWLEKTGAFEVLGVSKEISEQSVKRVEKERQAKED